jgi:hypothetical protein
MRRYKRSSSTKSRPHVAPGVKDISPEVEKQSPHPVSLGLEGLSREIAQIFLLCLVLFLVATFCMSGNLVAVSIILAKVVPKIIKHYFPKRRR